MENMSAEDQIKHSSEPWKYEDGKIIRADGQEVTSDRFMSAADKQRTIDCVNFCAGRESRHLNQTSLKEMIEHEEWCSKSLCAIEDALGLKNLQFIPEDAPLEKIRDMIAKIGEQGDEITSLNDRLDKLVERWSTHPHMIAKGCVAELQAARKG